MEDSITNIRTNCVIFSSAILCISDDEFTVDNLERTRVVFNHNALNKLEYYAVLNLQTGKYQLESVQTMLDPKLYAISCIQPKKLPENQMSWHTGDQYDWSHSYPLSILNFHYKRPMADDVQVSNTKSVYDRKLKCDTMNEEDRICWKIRQRFYIHKEKQYFKPVAIPNTRARYNNLPI